MEDTVCALMIIAAKGQPGETYNVGGNTEKTNIEVVNTICEILDELAPRYPKHIICHPEQSEGSLTHSTVTQCEVEGPPSLQCTTLQDSSALPQNDTPSCHPEQGEGSPSRLCTTSKDSSPLVQNDSYKYFITFVKDRPGHDQRYAINTSKIQTQLGCGHHMKVLNPAFAKLCSGF